MGRQAFGTRMVYRETFLQFQLRLQQHFIRRNCIHGVRYIRNDSFINGGEEWESNTSSRSEMPIWTVSQRFSHLQWRRFFEELWGRPTTTADFGSSLWQIHHTSNVCLLEDKIPDWGMYLFTISYGSYAMDQRSGDGWVSEWEKIFIINTRYFNAEFWSTHWTESSIILTSKEESVWRYNRPRRRTVSFADDRSLTWSTSTSGSLEPTILSRI